MNDIPEENWERAFSKHDGGWVEEQLDNQEASEKKEDINPLDHEQTH